MRSLLFSLLFAAVAVAQSQTSRVATDYQGRVVLFESPYPLKGETLTIDRILAFQDGAATVAAVSEERPFYGGVIWPHTNDNGDLRAYTFYRPGLCMAIGGCSPHTHNGVVRHASDGWEVRRPGRAGLSREGRWAVFSGSAARGTTWIDLWTGVETVVPEVLNVASVADDGTLATAAGSSVTVRSPSGEQRVFPLDFFAVDTLIDRTARYVAIAGQRAVWRLDVTSGAVEPWVPWDNCELVDIGPQGSVLLFKQWGVMYAVREIGQPPRRLPEDGQWLHGAALSGDASFLIASTMDGIARYPLDGSSSQLLIPGATAFVNSLTVLAPGMWVRQPGLGQASAELRLNGRPVEPLSRSHTEALWVVPQETSTGTAVFEAGQPDSPFQPYRQAVPVQLAAPLFLLERDLGLGTGTSHNDPFIRHAGTGKPVTYSDPARPGESIEALMTGLNGNGPAIEWLLNKLNVDEFVHPAFEGEAPHAENPYWTWVRLKLPATLPTGTCALGAVYGIARSGALIAADGRP